MKVRFAGRVPKDPAYPEANEDAVALAPETGRIAVSDGASESFDSKTWAELLTTKFIGNAAVNESWVAEAIAEYGARLDPTTLTWSKRAAYERGSFATLLGVEVSSARVVELLAVGDSVAALLDDNNFVESFPYSDWADFDRRPDLFATVREANEFFSAADFSIQHRRTWSLEGRSSPTVLCMTDALGAWALRDPAERCLILSGIGDEASLHELVLRERSAGNMRIDDATLVSLSFGVSGGDRLSDA